MHRKPWISSGSRFESEVGYARAVVVGDMVFVSETIGYDYAEMTIVEGVEGLSRWRNQIRATASRQFEQTMSWIRRVLASSAANS